MKLILHKLAEIHKQLPKTRDPEHRLELLKQMRILLERADRLVQVALEKL